MPEKKSAVPILNDDHLYLVPLSAGIIRAKLRREEFTYPIDIIDIKSDIAFPSEWPGDILFAFEGWSGQCDSDTDIIPGTFAVIDRVNLSAIGAIGTKSDKFPQDNIEVGYGINPSAQCRGFATNALQLISNWLFTFPEIMQITAETSQSNKPSQRVLEKCGFTIIGTGSSDEDGDLFLWQKSR